MIRCPQFVTCFCWRLNFACYLDRVLPTVGHLSVLGETQKKKAKVILRTGGLLLTWIHMWSLPWSQKPPSCGSHECCQLRPPASGNIVIVFPWDKSDVSFMYHVLSIRVALSCYFPLFCPCIWGCKASLLLSCFMILPLVFNYGILPLVFNNGFCINYKTKGLVSICWMVDIVIFIVHGFIYVFLGNYDCFSSYM